MIKVKWIVAPVPTGRFRSFEVRGWPVAEYVDGPHAGRYAASIFVPSNYRYPYVPREVKTGQHPPLKITLYDYSGPERKRYTSRLEYTSVAHCRLSLQHLLSQLPMHKSP